MFVRVVGDVGIGADGNDAVAGTAGKRGTRDVFWARAGGEGAGERVAGGRLLNLPGVRGAGDYGGRNDAALDRKDALGQVHGSFSANVQRMDRHDTDGAGVRANPSGGGGPPGGEAAATKIAGNPDPAEAGVENPAAVVVREPAPGLIANEAPAECGILKPATARKRTPAKADAVGTPAVTVAADGEPRAVGVEVAESGGVRGVAIVLQRGGGGGDHGIDATADPAIEIVAVRKASDIFGVGIRGAHGKRLALRERGS